jgi:hypothetical protein
VHEHGDARARVGHVGGRHGAPSTGSSSAARAPGALLEHVADQPVDRREHARAERRDGDRARSPITTSAVRPSTAVPARSPPYTLRATVSWITRAGVHLSPPTRRPERAVRNRLVDAPDPGDGAAKFVEGQAGER